MTGDGGQKRAAAITAVLRSGGVTSPVSDVVVTYGSDVIGATLAVRQGRGEWLAVCPVGQRRRLTRTLGRWPRAVARRRRQAGAALSGRPGRR